MVISSKVDIVVSNKNNTSLADVINKCTKRGFVWRKGNSKEVYLPYICNPVFENIIIYISLMITYIIMQCLMAVVSKVLKLMIVETCYCQSSSNIKMFTYLFSTLILCISVDVPNFKNRDWKWMADPTGARFSQKMQFSTMTRFKFP